MTVNFGSTFAVSLDRSKQHTTNGKRGAGINPAKKDALKELALEHGGYAPKHRSGRVKFSCRKKFDDQVLKRLKELKFLDFEMAPEHHNVKPERMNQVIAKHADHYHINGDRLVRHTPVQNPKKGLVYAKECIRHF